MSRAPRFLPSIVMVLALAALALGACGGDERSGAASATPSPRATVPAETASPAPGVGQGGQSEYPSYGGGGLSPSPTGALPMPSPTPAPTRAAPTATPASQPTAPSQPMPSPTPTAAAGPALIELTAQNFAFSQARIEVAAGARVTVRLQNRDGVPHNFALYTNAEASQGIASSPAAQPGGTAEVTFTAPSQPGEYFFRCNFHPDFMTGTLVVR